MSEMKVIAKNATLVEDPGAGVRPDQAQIAQVAADYGVHPLTQMREILLRRISRQKLGSNEYYDFRVFDPAHDRAAKNEFWGQGAINDSNMAINPDSLMETKNFLGNKLVYTAHLADRGIPTTETQAFVARGYGASSELLIDTAEGLVQFLKERARFPLFGKPQGGSKAVGTVRIDRIEGDTLHLGNGEAVSVQQLATEIFGRYADGYLLQSALTPHTQLAEATGDALCCVRLVTYRDGDTFSPLYAVWRLPGPKAMSDNFWQSGSMLALMDMSDGTVATFIQGKGLHARDLTHHPVSGAKIMGLKLPHWDALCEVARATHAITPDLGIIGHDIAITDKGPVVIEANDRPNHVVYQYAARRGIYNPEFKPILDRLAAKGRRA